MHPRTLDWFTAYADSHRHPTNRLTHKVAIPAIVFHVVAMLAWIPLGVTVGGLPVTGAWVGWVVTSVFWTLHLPRSGALLSLAVLPAALWGGLVDKPIVIAIAVVAWLVQLAGHVIWEKNSPAFLQNLLQALVGPLFFVAVLIGEWPRPAVAAAVTGPEAA